ncbi:MAG TPA: hypothetical protein VMM56_09565 [Planctomycetaceae bacterium]|nr:hypothetical protein [Planctomycetaceae bacterium]
MLDPHPNLTESVISGLGWLYLIMFGMNLAWTFRTFKDDGHFKLFGFEVTYSSMWGLYSVLLLCVSLAHFSGASNPDGFGANIPFWMVDILHAGQWFINALANPVSYFSLSIALFAAVVILRKWLVRTTVAWTLLNVSLLFMAISIVDYDFRRIVGKPDNVPIVAMLFIVAFFTWLYFRRAIDNDERIEQGKPLFEQEKNDKVLVWPDLVYTELICMVVVTAILVLWGVALQAPLEEPANAAATPNPSKAPWYFLGLQEMLVYFDPWLAGVVLPSLILVGLMAIPYIDFNKRGNGYYSFKERQFSVLTFMFGFLPLWVAMIVLGTFLRGPNWNFFGIYEFWDVHKLEVANNVNLSEKFYLLWWTKVFFNGMPSYDPKGGAGPMLIAILLRELPGFLCIVFYLGVLPMLGAMTIFRTFYLRMGFIRYMVFANLLLMMASLPIKMVLRWTMDLKYIVSIPEFFFNI